MKGTLAPELVARATRIGRERHAARGETVRSVQLDEQEALAEQAVGIALNREWKGEWRSVEKWKVWSKLGIDVTGIQVRRTSYTTGTLSVHESDPDDHVFILVLDRDAPEFVVAGWMLGRDAKKPAYWTHEEDSVAPPTFEVPQTELKAAWDLRLSPEHTGDGERKRDPAQDFGGKGRFPQRRYADDGKHPSKYGNIITSKFALPCCRCQTIIPAGELVGGNLVTGTIHGDPGECRKAKPRASL